MKVSELIEKLQQLDQEAIVNCYGGHDFEYGEQWQEISEVDYESARFDPESRIMTYEVFLK